MYLQTLWPLDGSEEPMNWSPQYTFALWKEQHFIFARVVIQMEILQIQKVGTQSTFFMILVFFFILYFWRFWNIHREYFRPRRALVKTIWSRAKIIIWLSWNFGTRNSKVSDNIDDDFVVDPSFVTLVAVLIQSYPVSQSGTCSEPTLAYWVESGENILGQYFWNFAIFDFYTPGR